MFTENECGKEQMWRRQLQVLNAIKIRRTRKMGGAVSSGLGWESNNKRGELRLPTWEGQTMVIKERMTEIQWSFVQQSSKYELTGC